MDHSDELLGPDILEMIFSTLVTCFKTVSMYEREQLTDDTI